jgi:CRISPR-associated protein Cmr5
MSKSTFKTLDSIRASVAYGFAQEASNREEYKSYVKKIPMMIKTNGLGATMSFIYSKKDKATYGQIYKQIESWFNNEDNPHCLPQGDFMNTIIELDSKQYRLVTTEILALFTWLRRFAEGLAKESKNGS